MGSLWTLGRWRELPLQQVLHRAGIGATAVALIPTIGVGSYALPGGTFAAQDWAAQGRLGTAEVREAYQDAVRLARGGEAPPTVQGFA